MLNKWFESFFFNNMKMVWIPFLQVLIGRCHWDAFSWFSSLWNIDMVYWGCIPWRIWSSKTLVSFYTAMGILERCGIQTSSLFVKIWLVCIHEFKAVFFAFIWLGFLSRIYWSLLDHDLMASIWEKAISILARNLNSGRS